MIPDAFLALDYMLDRFTWIVDGLVVYPGADAAEPRRVARPLLLAPAPARARRGGARPRRGVRARAAERDAAWDEERDFRELVAADPEIAAQLDADALADVFDLDATVRHVDTVFERLAALAPKEEPVHV